MPRRVALAIALAFTTVVSFMIIALGVNAGMFFGGDDGDADAAVAEEASPDDVAAALQYLAAISAPTQAPAPAAAEVVTEYVYLYEDVVVPAPSGDNTTAPRPTATTKARPTAVATATEEPIIEEEEVVAAPTAPNPTATAPAAAPTSAPPPPPPAGPSEMEFTGTVASINGSSVTWSYSGGTLTTQVGGDLEGLAVGTVAKVHALKVSTGYVAKEIEIED